MYDNKGMLTEVVRDFSLIRYMKIGVTIANGDMCDEINLQVGYC